MHSKRLSGNEFVVVTSVHVIEDVIESRNPMEDMLNDAFGFMGHDVDHIDEGTGDDGAQDDILHGEGNTNIDVLLKGNNEPLYESCTKYSKLSFILKLYHIK